MVREHHFNGGGTRGRGVNVTTRTGEDRSGLFNVTTRTTGKAGKCERMDSPLSLEVVQCRQFDPVTRPFTMNERSEYISYYLFIVSGDTVYLYIACFKLL